MDLVKKRIILSFFVILILFIVLLVNAFRLQVLPSEKLLKFASGQYKAEVRLSSKRGDIFDRDGVPLAITVLVDSLYASPVKIKDKNKTARILSEITGTGYLALLKKISNNRAFVWLKRLLSEEESKKINTVIKELEGIYTVKEPKRFYPNHSLASHLLGFVGIDSEGLSGVERYYDKYLSGGQRKVAYKKDARGKPIYDGDNIFSIDYSGNSIFLTIDSSLQYQIENELKAAVDKWKARSGTVIVMDPNSGEILAMANYPDYDPNSAGDYQFFYRRNRAITDVFEPGSIFKIVTAALSIKYNVVTPDTKLWGENGHFKIGTGKYAKIIKEAAGHDYGWMDLSTLIAKSSNVGSAKLGIMLGAQKFYEGIDLFGFGKRTDIDLPGEVKGIVNMSGRELLLATMAFGQGIAVTPVQMAMAYSIIANGGYEIVPHIVKMVKGENNNDIFVGKDLKGRQIISGESSVNLASMLRMVVETGTGTATDISGFEVAGKTGTAQKPDPLYGGYYRDKYIATFSGFFPVSDPRYTILVLIDEPQGHYYASIVAVPLFRNIANLLIQNSEIFPKNKPDEHIVSRDSKKLINKVAEKNNKKTLKFFIPDLVPDIKGLSLREALNLLSSEWEEVNINGSGKVFKQLPEPGKRDKGQKEITLWLK